MAMPTNSATQSISFSEMQTEFGGSNPVGFGEYYRGGAPASAGTARVPSYYTAQVAQYVARGFNLDSFSVNQSDGGVYGAAQVWYYAGVAIMAGAGGFSYLSAAQNSTAFSYKRGALNNSVYTPYNAKTEAAAYTTYYYVIERYQYVNVNTSVNGSVPQSGTISLAQFYNTQDYS